MDVSGLFSFEINVNILMRQSVAARGNDRTRPQLVSWRSCFHDVEVDNVNVSSYIMPFISIIITANKRKTSLPYFEVKLSCVSLIFAYRKKRNDL